MLTTLTGPAQSGCPRFTSTLKHLTTLHIYYDRKHRSLQQVEGGGGEDTVCLLTALDSVRSE